jgi:hypothetical protein
MWPGGGGNSQVDIPETGKYYGVGGVKFLGSATDMRAWLKVNGADDWNVAIVTDTAGAGDTDLMTSGPLLLTSGDYVELCVYHNKGSNMDVSAWPLASPYLSLHWLSEGT